MWLLRCKGHIISKYVWIVYYMNINWSWNHNKLTERIMSRFKLPLYGDEQVFLTAGSRDVTEKPLDKTLPESSPQQQASR